MKPVKLELLIDDKTLKGILSAEGNLDRLKKYAEGSIKILEGELNALQKEYKAALDSGTRNKAREAEIQALTGKIAELREGLQQLGQVQGEVAGKPIVDGGALQKAKNLNNAVAQIARELPALSMGPQMFFLAVSNNIPILADAIKNAREEYARLMQTTGKATPVWKQLLGSIVSWQSALALGVTVLVMYGDEIGDWVTSLFKGKDAALSLADATKKINESLRENSKGFAEQVTLVKSLAARWEALGGDVAAQKKFLQDNREELDRTGMSINSVGEAERLLAKGTDSYVRAMELRAKATTAFNLAVEAQQRQDDKRAKLQQRKQEGPGFLQRNRWIFGAAGYLLIDDYKDEIKEINIEMTEADTEMQNYLAKMAQYQKEAAELLNKLGLKEGTSASGNTKDFAAQLAEARVEADRKAERARIAVMQEGVEKRKALAAQERAEEIERINKEEKEQMALLAKARKAGQKVSATEGNEISSVAMMQRVAAEEVYLRKIAEIDKEWQEEGVQAWIEYNKQYGSAQEKRLAITAEYSRKIAAAQHEGEKAGLRAAMKKELQEVNMQELTQSIDFTDVFGRLDQMTTEALKGLRDKLREYVRTMQGDLNATDLKTLQDALNRIDRTISRRRPAASLKEGFDGLVAAQKEVAAAQELVQVAQEKGEVVVQEYSQETGELTTVVMSLADAEKKLEKAQNAREKAMSDLAEGTEALAAKMRDVHESAVSVIGYLESLGVAVDGDLKGVVEGFGQAAEGMEEMADAAKSGNVFGVISGAVKNLAGNVKMLGSAFGTDWGGEKSREQYEKAKEKYEAYMDVLDRVIEKQKELVASMEADDYANAGNSYEKAKELLSGRIDYARQMGRNYLNSGASSGFVGIGSSASQGVKQSEAISREAWKQLKDVMGPAVMWQLMADDRMTSLFEMPVEQLIKLRDEATGFYAELHEETRYYIEEIIAAYEALEDVEVVKMEGLTKTGLDEFKNSYLSVLLDLDSSNEDFAKNLEKQLQKAVLTGLFNDKYKTEIENLYKDWAAAMESGGELTPEEAADLQRRNRDLAARQIADREAAEKAFGWDSYSTQSGRAGSAINITEETAGRLEGIGNATLDHVAMIDDTSLEIRDSLAGAAGSLARIAENSEHLKRLDEIADNIQSMSFTGIKIKN